jgi:23S rRNA (adenine2503-C2)-methyltransferase
MNENLKGLNEEELKKIFIAIDEKPYRAKQMFQWLYQKQVSGFDEISNISNELKQKLSDKYRIANLNISDIKKSSDGTVKFLFELEDKNYIESVIIPPISVNRTEKWIEKEDPDRLTICISTQAGCPLGCTFCATGYMKYKRNLSAYEIIDQVIQAQKNTEKRITNIVFMGMGEPLLNYENVIKAIEIFNHDTGLNIAQRRITVSTSGIIPGIKRMADENRKFKLAISLHSLDNEIRSEIMPINKKYPLNELISSLKYYNRITKQRPTLEFILFDKINDKDSDVRKMIALSKQLPCKFNIIHFNASPLLKTTLKSSTRIEEVIKKLRDEKLTVMVRNSSGEDIAAACGQLAANTGV